MKQLVISLLLICSAESSTLKMEILEGELNIYEGYQPIAGVTTFVTNTTDNIEFSSPVIIANANVSGTSKDVFYEPPVGYIQWLYGGTASALPTNDKIFLVTAPTVDGTNSIIQTGGGILPYITIYFSDGPADGIKIPYWSDVNKTRFINFPTFPPNDVFWNGANWWAILAGAGIGVFTNEAATNTFPPKTLWVEEFPNEITMSIGYDSFWIDSGEFVTNTYADLIANPQGTNAVYLRFDSSSNILEIITYPEVLSGSDHTQALNYISSALLPNMDTNGVPSVDLSGFDAFSPSVADGSIHSRSPAIAEWTRQANTNDTIALTAEDL